MLKMILRYKRVDRVNCSTNIFKPLKLLSGGFIFETNYLIPDYLVHFFDKTNDINELSSNKYNNKKKIKIIIFTEAGEKIGFGHLTRCISLYEAAIEFGVSAELVVHGNFDSTYLQNKISIKNENWLSESYLESEIENSDYCIVDSYLISKKLCDKVAALSKKALFLDDNVRISYPQGIVVNPSFYTDESKYPTTAGVDYLLGSKYIILRKDFINRNKNRINKVIQQVLVIMGGTDIRKLTPRIIELFVNKYHDIKFNVVINDNKESNFSSKYVKNKNIVFYQDLNGQEIAKLMIDADLAITAAGQTMYELIAIGTPFIPVKIVDNQRNNIMGLKIIKKDHIYFEFDDEEILNKLEIEFKKMMNYNLRSSLSKSYRNKIDGLGSKRILKFLLGNNNEI